MPNLRPALAYAAARDRVPAAEAALPASVRGLARRVGLTPPASLRRLVDLLNLPGNFIPGQPLAAGAEIGFIHPSYQLDLYAIGMDHTPWKFWEYNDGEWMHGIVSNSVPVEAGVPLAVVSAGGVGTQDVAIQIFAPLTAESGILLLTQNNGGKWTAAACDAAALIPMRGTPTAYLDDLSVFAAVDSTGVLCLFRQEEISSTGPFTRKPLSGPQFPPGSPVAVDTRVVSIPDTLRPIIFAIDNDGVLWQFQAAEPYGDHWTGSKMPNPFDVKLKPGSHIATGYQSALQSVGLETNSLGYSQLDVFVVDQFGVLQLWWESQGSDWLQLPMPNAGNLPPGAPIATGLQVYDMPERGLAIGNQLDVFVVDIHGRLARWWVYRSGAWAQDFLPDTYTLPPGAHITTAHQQVDGNKLFQQLDVFVVDTSGRIAVYWQNQGPNGAYPWASRTMPGSDLPVLPAPL